MALTLGFCSGVDELESDIVEGGRVRGWDQLDDL
jgi:hypothetical protein